MGCCIELRKLRGMLLSSSQPNTGQSTVKRIDCCSARTPKANMPGQGKLYLHCSLHRLPNNGTKVAMHALTLIHLGDIGLIESHQACHKNGVA